MVDPEAAGLQFFQQVLLFIASGMACSSVVLGPLTHVGRNRENQRTPWLKQLQPLPQAIHIALVVFQHFKRNNQAKPLVQRKEVPGLEFNGSGPESLASLMLGNQLWVQVETKAVKSSIDQIFIESAAAHANFKEPPRRYSTKKPVSKKSAV